MGQEESDIILIFASSSAIIVVLAVLVALFVVIYQKRIMAQEARLQRLENDFQREMLQATIEGQERERKRLAKDLHDSIGSMLTGLRFNLKQQQGQSDNGAEQQKYLDEACTIIDDGIVEVRRVSHDLLPVTLESFGLLQAVKDTIDSLQSEEFEIAMTVSGTEYRLSPSIELGLLRVIQELLQNTIRHAQASKAEIVFEFSTANITLRYYDNGIGLNSAEQTNGIGIKNMQSRILALDGKITFGNGKRFDAHIHIPTQ